MSYDIVQARSLLYISFVSGTQEKKAVRRLGFGWNVSLCSVETCNGMPYHCLCVVMTYVWRYVPGWPGLLNFFFYVSAVQ